MQRDYKIERNHLMHHRKIASRLLRRGAMFLPVAAAALAFAPLASAQYAQPTVTYTPTTTAALEADVSSADGAAPGTLSIIQLQPQSAVTGLQYFPTVPLLLSGDIEVTGPPQYQNLVAGTVVGGDATVNGQDEETTPTPVDLFTVEQGANVLFKAFDVETGSPIGNASIRVDAGGVAEIDNMGFEGDATAVILNPGGSGINDGAAVITNTNMSQGTYDSVENNTTTPVVYVNDTMTSNAHGGISGPATVINSILAGNTGGGQPECAEVPAIVVDSISDDTSCGTASPGGVISSTFRALKVVTTNGPENGGPTESVEIGSAGSAVGKANTAYCTISDQRFYLRTPSTCDVGAYQTTGAQDSSTAGPVCTPNAPVYTSNPATMTVDAQDSVNTIGLGPDAITNLQSVLSSNPAVANGAATWPIVGTTWFDETNPSASSPFETDFASTSAFPVTDAKPKNDTTQGDTSWSFMAQNWLGFSTFCH